MLELIYCLNKKPDAYLLKEIHDEALNYTADISIRINDKLVSAKNLYDIFNIENNGNSLIICTEGVDEAFAMDNIGKKLEKWCMYM